MLYNILNLIKDDVFQGSLRSKRKTVYEVYISVLSTSYWMLPITLKATMLLQTTAYPVLQQYTTSYLIENEVEPL